MASTLLITGLRRSVSCMTSPLLAQLEERRAGDNLLIRGDALHGPDQPHPIT